MFASAGKRKYPFLNQEICHQVQAANVQHRILTDSQHFLPKRVCIGNQLESSNQVRLTTIREEIYNSMQMNRTNTAVNQHQTTHIGQTTDNCSMEISPEEQHYVNSNLNNNSMCEGNRQQSVRCTRCEAGQGGHFQHIFQ